MKEWNDDEDAMLSALEIINRLILKLSSCEETAWNEAKKVERIFWSDIKLNREQLIDYLKQATIDYNVNKKE